MLNYENIIKEAESYSRTVIGCFEKKKFDNTFLLGLTTMSLEKYLVAYIMSKDYMPKGHTLTYLIEEMLKYTSVPWADVDLIISLDEKIQLCSLDLVDPYIPTDAEMQEIIKTLCSIQMLVKNVISSEQIN